MQVHKIKLFSRGKKITTKELEGLSIFNSFFAVIFKIVNLFFIEFDNRIYDVYYSKI